MELLATFTAYLAAALLVAWIVSLLALELQVRRGADGALRSIQRVALWLQAAVFASLLIACLALMGLASSADRFQPWAVFMVLSLPVHAVDLVVAVKLIGRHGSGAPRP